ncbi:MAG: DUF1499 domain-containing protein [Desulfobacterales bacterium]|nr:MAG: DUF1499 domain-containing protein [Desulfobacterales bacterium]
MVSILSSCSGKPPDAIGIRLSGLTGCPKSPNCVSSKAKGAQHIVEPFLIKGDAKVSWSIVKSVIISMPNCLMVTATTNYIHAECRSRIFRFADDLELFSNSSSGMISIRSASRIGYSDFGVNRRRVEFLRSELRAKRAIE